MVFLVLDESCTAPFKDTRIGRRLDLWGILARFRELLSLNMAKNQAVLFTDK